MNKKKIIIVGGGFGGVKLGLVLQKHPELFEVTIISSQPYFEYHSALYRSATGWSPKEVILPLTDIFNPQKAVKIVQATIISLNRKEKKVVDSDGISYAYDEVVFSLGQVSNYYGIEGMADGSYGLNTIKKAIRLRQQLREQVVDQPGRKNLSFVVIGGGATGVELASELGFFVRELSEKYNAPHKSVDVTLVEGAARILPILSPKASKYAEWRLEELGVKILLNAKVTGLKDRSLLLENGKLEAETVVWTAGASNNPFFNQNENDFTLAPSGKVEVDEYLQARDGVYVIGDNANTQYSGMAQTALSDAMFVGSNMIHEARKKSRSLYSPARPIYSIPAGRNYAIVQWGRVVVRGYPGWILRRIADFKIFAAFEPYKKAIKSWRSGNERAHGYEVD